MFDLHHFQEIFISLLPSFYHNLVIIFSAYLRGISILAYLKNNTTCTYVTGHIRCILNIFLINRKYFDIINIFVKCISISANLLVDFYSDCNLQRISVGNLLSNDSANRLPLEWTADIQLRHEAMFLMIMVQIDRSKLSNIEMDIRPRL